MREQRYGRVRRRRVLPGQQYLDEGWRLPIADIGEDVPGRWTDACVSCEIESDGSVACNNIGIACQPESITCTTRRNASAK